MGEREWTEADQRSDLSFLVGCNFGRESERAQMLAEGYVLIDSPAMRDLLAEAWDAGARGVIDRGIRFRGTAVASAVENPYRGTDT